MGRAFALEDDRPPAYSDEHGSAPILGLSHYRPIYFLVGKPHTKVELSFKTQIVDAVPLYFAYTQLMMWDIFVKSPFFYDLNYNPLIFYRLNLSDSNKQWLDLIPIEHESNGRGGAEERSWNRVALQYHFSHIGILDANVKAWFPYHYKRDNPDILRYRGLWQLELGLSRFMGERFDFNDLVLRLNPGGKSLMDPTRGGQELTFRLQVKSFKFLPLFVVQLFHGYGESLQDYSVSHWEARAGFGF